MEDVEDVPGDGVPNGDHRSLLRLPRIRLLVPGPCTKEHLVRQHPSGGNEVPGTRLGSIATLP